MSAVFLSASVPERGRPYYETSDPVAIRDAVRALVGVCLSKGDELVFGGHPAISPLVWQVASGLGLSDRVTIYQSRFFEARIPKDSLAFRRFAWTPTEFVKGAADRDASLTRMREEMIRSRGFTMAFFVGGMDGTEEEFALFGKICPGVARHCVASTGGAALALWKEHADRVSPHEGAMETERSYGSLFRRFLS